MAEEDTIPNPTTDPIISPSFPSGRIKKIMKLDKDISKITSEALFLVSCSADLFLGLLAVRSAQAAIKKKRKTVNIKHFRSAVTTHRPTADFLLDSLPTVPTQQPKEKEKEKEKEEERPLPRGTQRIDRFFNKGD